MRRKVLAIVVGLVTSLVSGIDGGRVVAGDPRPTVAPAEACATAPPVGAWVGIASETAVVVWDEAARREHFIRRASFRSSAKDFGFLVPTPTKPELAEIDQSVFGNLEWATRPEVRNEVDRSGIEIGSAFLLTRSETASAPAAAPVRVLDEATVAGYDAVVLEADDPSALAKWLSDHGYDARPALSAWLAPYVAARWKITAFKVASPSAAAPQRTLGTQAVRMSFATETPFFPYREPADQREARPQTSGAAAGPDPAARELLVYVVAAQRMSPSIGKSGAFPGSIPFAKRLGRELPKAVADLLPGADPFVTVVVDPSSPRPGTDELYFAPSGDQSDVVPAPVVRVVRRPFFVPVEGVILVVGFGALCFHLVRRTRRARA